MAKRGRPKKSGDRKPCGRLRAANDNAAAELVMLRRAELVGAENAKSADAGHPLGILKLRGRITEAECDAGLVFAKLHAIVFGSGQNPRSNLAAAVAQTSDALSDLADDDRATMIRRAERMLRESYARGYVAGGRPGMTCIENAVIHHQGIWAADPAGVWTKEDWSDSVIAPMKAVLADWVRFYKVPDRTRRGAA